MLPVVLTLLGPGAGHLYMGRRTTGIAVMGALLVFLAGIALSIYSVAVAMFVWLAAIAHVIVIVARKTAYAPRAGEAAIGWVALMVALALVRMFVVQAFSIPSSAMHPTLLIGDHVFISKLFVTPERGDLIVFDHPCMPERAYIKRVVALGKDTVEVRCGTLFVNGKAMPRALVTASETYTDRDGVSGEAFTRHASRHRTTIGDHTFDIYLSVDGRDQFENPMDFPRETEASCETERSMMGNIPSSTDQAHGTIVTTRADAAPCEPTRHYVVPDGHVFTMGDNRDNSNDSRFWGSVPVSYIKGRVRGIWYPIGRFGPVD